MLLAKVLKSHQDSFRRWLRKRGDELGFKANYWNHLVKILDISAHYGFIDSSLNEEVLTRIETELLRSQIFSKTCLFLGTPRCLLLGILSTIGTTTPKRTRKTRNPRNTKKRSDEADEGPEGFSENFYTNLTRGLLGGRVLRA